MLSEKYFSNPSLYPNLLESKKKHLQYNHTEYNPQQPFHLIESSCRFINWLPVSSLVSVKLNTSKPKQDDDKQREGTISELTLTTPTLMPIFACL
jgi:hypothetical protein